MPHIPDRYEVPANLAQGEPRWIRSRFSHGADHTCVEVAFTHRSVRVRDSKDPAGPALSFSQREWEVFLLGVRAGDFGAADADLQVSSPQSVQA